MHKSIHLNSKSWFNFRKKKNRGRSLSSKNIYIKERKTRENNKKRGEEKKKSLYSFCIKPQTSDIILDIHIPTIKSNKV